MNVQLVRHGPEHLEETYRWLTSVSGLRDQIDSLAAPASKAQNEAYWRAKWNDLCREDYAILLDREYVGNCGLTSIDSARRKAELWVYLAKARGFGAGTEVMKRLLDRAFAGLNLNRVYLRVLATNSAARKFYQKVGFQEDGIARHDTIQSGVPVDSYLMSMLRHEYTVRVSGNVAEI